MSVDPVSARQALVADERATEALRRQLVAELDGVIHAVADVATDDEHDPEGATIAYERARAGALIRQAEDHLGEIRLALARLHDGTYGTCERCGADIAAERLTARPAVRTCVSCAAGPGRRR